MIYSIDKQINGKFAIVVLDQDKEGNFIPTTITDWITGSFSILLEGRKVGEISARSDSVCIQLHLTNSYIECVAGAIFPRIHCAKSDLLLFRHNE